MKDNRGVTMTNTAEQIPLEVVTQGMVGTHRIFRREFPLMPDIVRSVADGDADRAGVVANHVRLVLDLVHIHHDAEEQFIWDILPSRAPEGAEIVGTMLSQHGNIAELTAVIHDSLEAWENAPTADTSQAVAKAIEAFTKALVDHATLEEGEPLPLIAAHLSPEEWGAFGAYASTAMPEETRGIVMGMMLEGMSPEEREEFLGRLPPPAAEAMRTTGAEMYAKYVARVRSA